MCGCVDVRGMQERSACGARARLDVATQSAMGPRGSNGTAGGFVNGHSGRLEAAGTQRRRGEERANCDSTSKGPSSFGRGRSRVIYKYATRDEAKTKGYQGMYECGLILPCTATTGPATCVVPSEVWRTTCVTWVDRY